MLHILEDMVHAGCCWISG